MNFSAPGTSSYTFGGTGISGEVDALYLRYSTWLGRQEGNRLRFYFPLFHLHLLFVLLIGAAFPQRNPGQKEYDQCGEYG